MSLYLDSTDDADDGCRAVRKRASVHAWTKRCEAQSGSRLHEMTRSLMGSWSYRAPLTTVDEDIILLGREEGIRISLIFLSYFGLVLGWVDAGLWKWKLSFQRFSRSTRCAFKFLLHCCNLINSARFRQHVCWSFSVNWQFRNSCLLCRRFSMHFDKISSLLQKLIKLTNFQELSNQVVLPRQFLSYCS